MNIFVNIIVLITALIVSPIPAACVFIFFVFVNIVMMWNFNISQVMKYEGYVNLTKMVALSVIIILTLI